MKKLLLTLTLVAATATMYGQGRIGFDNLGTLNPVTVALDNQGPSGGNAGDFVGANYSVQLVWAPQASYGTLAAFEAAILGSSTAVAFYGVTGTAPGSGPTVDGAGLFDGGNVPVAAGNYTVAARAWFNGGTYATFQAASGSGAANVGYSGLVNTASTEPPTPANFPAFAPFTVGVVIPEPSTFALAGLGLAGLLIFRRRNK